jgi:hypothetical protein
MVANGRLGRTCHRRLSFKWMGIGLPALIHFKSTMQIAEKRVFYSCMELRQWVSLKVAKVRSKWRASTASAGYSSMTACRWPCYSSLRRTCYPGVSTEDVGVWPADDGELIKGVAVP